MPSSGRLIPADGCVLPVRCSARAAVRTAETIAVCGHSTGHLCLLDRPFVPARPELLTRSIGAGAHRPVERELTRQLRRHP